MPDQSVDCILTDPMYYKPLDMPELLRVCKGNIIAFGMPIYRYFVPDRVHHWIKPQSTKNVSKSIPEFVEEINVLLRGTYNGPSVTGMQWANYNGVYFDIIEGKKVHDFQKPLALIERLMMIYSNPGDIIFDPFAGSGTTLWAARGTGRNAIGCENDKIYYDAIMEKMR